MKKEIVWPCVFPFGHVHMHIFTETWALLGSKNILYFVFIFENEYSFSESEFRIKNPFSFCLCLAPVLNTGFEKENIDKPVFHVVHIFYFFEKNLIFSLTKLT